MLKRFTRAAIATAVAVAASLTAAIPANAVVGGRVDTNPRIAQIFIDNHGCTGTLIASDAVITARHCIPKKNTKNVVYLGDDKFHITSAILHPDTDLAVVKLDHASNLSPIALSSARVQPGTKGIAVGLGGIDQHIIPTNDNFAGDLRAEKTVKTNKSSEIPNIITIQAAVSNGRLQPGDSGGPMLVNGKIAGVLSMGTISPLTNAATGEKGFYVPIAEYLAWIGRAANISVPAATGPLKVVPKDYSASLIPAPPVTISEVESLLNYNFNIEVLGL